MCASTIPELVDAAQLLMRGKTRSGPSVTSGSSSATLICNDVTLAEAESVGWGRRCVGNGGAAAALRPRVRAKEERERECEMPAPTPEGAVGIQVRSLLARWTRRLSNLSA
jgi:hypothetical protein